ncbi:Uncharacterized protein LSUE1_G004445 [Lachnellula suecica]|uniref:Uncharacterized protein n=1 Tax=Lachnellula suecica TaxID=602035 RepID=A0A8T9C9K6_9HELO|nr:Uncharacterized protein LSUE1_G004445 [Lachnellula suecica]
MAHHSSFSLIKSNAIICQILLLLALVSSASGSPQPPHSHRSPRPVTRAEANNHVVPRAPNDYIVAAYYFGNFHVDPRNEAEHGKGWTEWKLTQEATPRFDGHKQPKVPSYGYADESDPAVFATKIDDAVWGSVSALIFDWYYYNDGPFLEAALEEGFLKAPNRGDIDFAIMWANHDWYDIHPANLNGNPKLQFPGVVTPVTFDKMTTYIVEAYFKQPNYLKIDGCPYFSIYQLYTFVQGMGGSTQAAAALQQFRAKVKAAGFPDLHLNAVTFGIQLLPGDGEPKDLKTMLQVLDVETTTSYVWIHHVQLSTWPATQYNEVAAAYEVYRANASTELGKPYFPCVSVGWDASPRTNQSEAWLQGAYPYTPVITNNTAQNVGLAMASAKDFLDKSTLTTKMVTVNSWNEWTEGSYLEPDEDNGWDFLNAIWEVFGQG